MSSFAERPVFGSEGPVFTVTVTWNERRGKRGAWEIRVADSCGNGGESMLTPSDFDESDDDEAAVWAGAIEKTIRESLDL